MPWLRTLDEDALAGRAASRLAITIPLALFVGCLLGGGIGFLGGLFVGLPTRYQGDCSVIAHPYVGALIGVVEASTFWWRVRSHERVAAHGRPWQ